MFRNRFIAAIWILGVLFVLSSVLKALDLTAFAVQISYYGVVRIPWAVQTIALGVIGVEAALGIAMLAGMAVRRIALPAVLALVGGFTLLLGWAWAFRDIENCGCFGKYLPMGPAESIAKNLAMMALAAWAWHGLWKGERILAMATEPQSARSDASDAGCKSKSGPLGAPFGVELKNSNIHRLPSVVGGALAVMALAVISPMGESGQASGITSSRASETVPLAAVWAESGGPFAKYSFEWKGRHLDLTQGVYLVGLISDSCAHCAEIVDGLNRLMKEHEIPPIIGLILGEEDTLKDFRQTYKPRFATRLIPVLEFFNLIGDAPPRFHLIREGRAIKYWDENVPSKSTILKATQEIQSDAEDARTTAASHDKS